MTHGDPHVPLPGSAGRSATFSESPSGRHGHDATPPPVGADNAELHRQWRVFGNVATGVAIFTAPAVFLALTRVLNWKTGAAVIVTILLVVAFRGLVDLVTRRFIPRPSLWGDDGSNRDWDIADRRRVWFWRFWFRVAIWIACIYVAIVGLTLLVQILRGRTDLGDAFLGLPRGIRGQFSAPDAASNWIGLAVSIPILFLVNTVIFLGPLAYTGIRQIKIYEPGDVDWGTRVEDVRGQRRATEAVTQIVTLWQSGEVFKKAGGKPESGLLFNGPPGTGKTMLARAIATRFNCPFISAPGTTFAASFVGVDVLLVMFLGWRARRVARKWGGQCIIFIDEIDALGGRRDSLMAQPARIASIHDVAFFGAMGAITPSGDLVMETPEWRDRLFTERARRNRRASAQERLGTLIRRYVMPGLGGGSSGGLQQILVLMDGLRDPPAVRKFVVKRINALLDALYVLPRRVGPVRLRIPPARPMPEQLYFIGACNVDLDWLDPALTRPGRLGRQVLFHTPDVSDRRDIIDLYVGKVAHDADLDRDQRRDEFARITNGFSPAMLEQTCSVALTIAHYEGRPSAAWNDIVRAVTIVEQGIDRGLEYIESEAYALAVHESGHAVAAHVYMKNFAATRLSLTARAGSLGHHQIGPLQKRYSRFQHEVFAEIVWTLGAMAAEIIFFGENSTGVGGDVYSATNDATHMVGTWGMAPVPIELPEIADPVAREIAERKTMRRFDQVGQRILNRAWQGSQIDGDPVASVLEDASKRVLVNRILGQAFMAAYWLVRHNKDATEKVARTLLEKRDIYGDDLVALLDSVNLTIPDIDPLDEDNWPRL